MGKRHRSNISEIADLPQLNLPPGSVKLKQEGGCVKGFEPFRKKWIIITPEEWVRLNFTLWLQNSLGYPSAFIANEIGLKINGLTKRCDTVVFNRAGKPAMIIEYKSPDVAISQKTFDQIFQYNLKLKCPFLVISNGLQHYCCKIDYNSRIYSFISNIPEWSVINTESNL